MSASNPSPARSLPERPNLDYLKKLAKDRLDELRQRDPRTKLAAAQLTIAREHGFTSWRKLKIHVEQMELTQLIPAFFDAIHRGDSASVGSMLRSTPRLAGVRDAHGASALGVAVEHNRADIVDLLAAAGAVDALAYSHAGHSPLSWALTVGSFDAAEALLRHGVEPDLFCAAGLGKLETVKSFFRNGRLRPHASRAGSTRYADGARLPCPPPTDREAISDALYIACRNGRTEVAHYLLQHDPDLAFGAYMNGTPLHWACFNGSQELINLLLAAGADPTLRDDTFRCTPRAFGICVPASWGIVQLVRWHLAQEPSLANILDGRGTPLWEAARSGHVEIVKLLLAVGADPRKGSRDGQTTRTIAEERGHAEVVHALDKTTAPTSTPSSRND